MSDISDANTIKGIPIPNTKSEVDAFLDDIFERALDDPDNNTKSEKFKINRRELRNKIKGGQNYIARQNLSEKRKVENVAVENKESVLLKFNSNPNLNYYACKVNVVNTRSVENLSDNIKGGNDIRNGYKAKNKVISIIDPAKIALMQTVYTKLVSYSSDYFSSS